jgi:hypothetical protein
MDVNSPEVVEALQHAIGLDVDAPRHRRAAAELLGACAAAGVHHSAASYGVALGMIIAMVRGQAHGFSCDVVEGYEELQQAISEGTRMRGQIAGINLGPDLMQSIQDAAGFRAERLALAELLSQKRANDQAALKAARDGCRNIHRALDMLEPPLQPARRTLLSKKAALLSEATTCENSVDILGEFLVAVDAALVAEPAARQYGRALRNTWGLFVSVHESLVGPWTLKRDMEWFGGADDAFDEEESENEDEYLESEEDYARHEERRDSRRAQYVTEWAAKRAAWTPADLEQRRLKAIDSTVQSKRLVLQSRSGGSLERVQTPPRLQAQNRAPEGGWPWDEQGVAEAPSAEAATSVQPIQHSLETKHVPPELCCSITAEVFSDPVLAVADGMTYERAAIEQWLEDGHDRSPTTGEAFLTRQLVPNHALRTMLQRLAVDLGLDMARPKKARSEELTCFLCLEGDEDLLPMGCSCRGSAGKAHLSCLADFAGSDANQVDGVRWHVCQTCKRHFTGPMGLGLAQARWALYRDRPEAVDERLNALSHLGAQKFNAGDYIGNHGR